MTKHLRAFLLAILLGALMAHPAMAADDNGDLDIVAHAADGFYLDFEPFGIVELPRMFVTRSPEGDLQFSSYRSTRSAVQTGQYNVRLEGEEGVVEGQDEAAVDGLLAGHKYIYAVLVPAEGELVADLSITRHLIFGLVAGVFMLFLFIGIANQYKRGVGREEAPRGVLQNMFEAMIVYIRDEVAKPTLGDKHEKFMPFLLTAFFFILFCNLFGLVPFGGSATGNIAVTGVLAGFTFFIGQIYATKDHWKHLFLGPEGVPWFVRPILVPVEILGLFTRHVALAIRLFANMMAGALVILSLLGIIFIINALFGPLIASLLAMPSSIILTVLILFIKFLVSFIQAYVFTLLSALFIGMSVEEHHSPEAEAPEVSDDAGDVTPGPGFSKQDEAEMEERTSVQPEPVPAST